MIDGPTIPASRRFLSYDFQLLIQSLMACQKCNYEINSAPSLVHFQHKKDQVTPNLGAIFLRHNSKSVSRPCHLEAGCHRGTVITIEKEARACAAAAKPDERFQWS